MELYQASLQWANRPVDERFWTLEEMIAACRRWKEEAVESDIQAKSLRFNPTPSGEVTLTGDMGIPARLLHHSFGQVSSLVGAPPSYLRTLTADLAARVLNHGLGERNKMTNGQLNILFRQNGGLDVRAVTSSRYARIWNADVLERLLPLREKGWRVPPARPAQGDPRAREATEEDVLSASDFGFGLSIKPGDLIAPAGLYASDKDCFAFLVNEERRIESGEATLSRGFFLQNSEVGDSSLRIVTFLYNHVCGNHIVWGASEVKEARFVHLGKKVEAKARKEIESSLTAYSDRDTTEETALIADARKTIIGKDVEEITDLLFEKRIASRKAIGKAFASAEAHPEDHGADPRSAWGMVNGFTRVSQGTPFTDRRVEADRAAGKILKIAF
jgi:hypothetical protein